MLLKSLQLQGFKSFADKTVIDFHPGVTGIVGPNGCGKSNVVDAIKWVLGETSAKALRGGEMADVIFNGTDRRQPHSLAEVTLTFSDCEKDLGVDYNEVAISRRVYRDGKGEYLINNTPCRLRDIHGLFMDTGIGQSAYSVMEQGKIDQLLSSKPEDRRAVFEEAAGITKFKTQKKEAMRKLEYTEANLLRVTDIIAELKRQIGSMQRQASKARRYQDLMKDSRVLDVHMSHKKFVEMAAEKGELATSIHSLKILSEELHCELGAKEDDITRLRKELERTDAQLNILKLQISEQHNKRHSAESRIGFNEERHREFEAQIEKYESEIDMAQIRQRQEQEAVQMAEDQLAHLRATLAEKQAALDEQTARARALRQEREETERQLRDVRRLHHQAETEIISANAKMSNHQAQLDTDGRRFDQLGLEVAKLGAERDERGTELTRLTEEIAAVRLHVEEQEIQLQHSQQEVRNAQADLKTATQAVNAAQKAAAQKQSRLDILRNLIAEGEGLGKGTQSVLSGLGNPEKYSATVKGLLSNYIEVEPQHVKAIEAALGAHLQTILIRDAVTAVEMIDLLTEGLTGEAVILPESFLPAELPRQLLTLPDRSMAWAMDQVRVKKPAGPILDYLLGNVLIVPDLTTALELRVVYPDVAFATERGEFMTPQGIIRGGKSQGEHTSMLQRQNEVKALADEVDGLQNALTAAEERQQFQQRHLGEVQAQIEEAGAVLQRSKLQHSNLQGALGLVKKEIESAKNRHESLEWEQNELGQRKDGLEAAMALVIETLSGGHSQLENHALRAAELEGILGQAHRSESEASEQLSAMKTALAVDQQTEDSLGRQISPMKSRLRELENLVASRHNEIANYHARIEAAAQENEGQRVAIAEAERVIVDLEETIATGQSQRHGLAEQVTLLDRELIGTRRRSAELAEQKGREEVRHTQLALRLENLTNGVNERYQTNLEAFEADYHTLLRTVEIVRAKRSTQDKRRATMTGRDDDSSDAYSAESGPSTQADAAPMPAAEMLGEGEEIMMDPNVMPEQIDWEFVEMAASELRQRLDAMGPVNLDAIQEFEELEERYNFLDKEHTDLTNSKTELLNILQKINVETKRMFVDTFKQVRINFQSTFKELFGPLAQSDLILVNEEDPLESGIDVIAKPPGKKPTSITLLSGGERSMTAVALLFSIYMVKPSPFCVLDELDAPLDESNIGRFLSMLDRFIDKSQFVIVTHNKKTMRRADVIYGVTMEEFGVSKPVGMHMTKNEEKQTALAAALKAPATQSDAVAAGQAVAELV
jgi:chromosome segregation protein